MTEEKESVKPLMSREEQYFIIDNLPDRSLHAIGMLSSVRRNGTTLDEEWKSAINEPGNEEHKEAFTQAYEFLKENSKRFSLPIEEK